MDVARADTVDASEAFDRLISRRASTDTRTTADEREEPWKASVRRFKAQQRAENRAARPTTTKKEKPCQNFPR